MIIVGLPIMKLAFKAIAIKIKSIKPQTDNTGILGLISVSETCPVYFSINTNFVNYPAIIGKTTSIVNGIVSYFNGVKSKSTPNMILNATVVGIISIKCFSRYKEIFQKSFIINLIIVLLSAAQLHVDFLVASNACQQHDGQCLPPGR